MFLKPSLASGAALGALLAIASPALAQTSIDALQQQIQALKAQQAKDQAATQQLQDQLKALQGQADQVKSAYNPSSGKNGLIQWGGVNLQLGGFTEAAGIFRSRNEVADVGSDFNNIPFPNNQRNHETELRFSARQSRISGLIYGDIDKETRVSAYLEADFLGASDVSNARESNSFLPRIRHFYTTVDENGWGFHFLAGQEWSLITTNTSGIMPRSEQIPLTIDAQYVPGFNWTRNPQARFVENFNDVLWVGLSVESPQALVGGNNPNGALFAANQANPNANNPGDPTGLLSANQNFTTDTYPDVVAKIALDPGFGHYELKGIARFFTDRFNTTNNTTVGGGGGAAATIPIVPKVLELQLSGLAGYGIGRYGSAQINDVSFNPNGSLVATPEIEVLLGLIATPFNGTQLYAYAGQEHVTSTAQPVGKGLFSGFGSNFDSNAGCNINLSAATCTSTAREIDQVTAGFWQD